MPKIDSLTPGKSLDDYTLEELSAHIAATKERKRDAAFTAVQSGIAELKLLGFEYILTTPAQRSGTPAPRAAKTCSICHESDHNARTCPLRPLPIVTPPVTNTTTTEATY